MVTDNPDNSTASQQYRDGYRQALDWLDECYTDEVPEDRCTWRDAITLSQSLLLEASDEGREFARGRRDALQNVEGILSESEGDERWIDLAFGQFREAAMSFTIGAITDPDEIGDAMTLSSPFAQRLKKRMRTTPAAESKADETIEGLASRLASDERLGFIQQVMAHNLENAPKPQPVFALAGALALTAAMVGRRVRDEFDGRTNLLIIAVGETASGKDFARQLNDEILVSSGLGRIVAGEEVTSDAAIFRLLREWPSRLAQFDEFGRFLQTAMQSKNSWLFNVVSALLKLYSSANRENFQPKAYAVAGPEKPDQGINFPHLVLHATSTPEAIYQGLGVSAEDDGFLGRCLIFESELQPRKKMRPRNPIPDAVIQFGQFWLTFADGNIEDAAAARPKVVETTPRAMAIFQKFDDYSHELLVSKSKGSKLWGRAEQKARQLALVIACSRVDVADPEAMPIVDRYDALTAVEIVRAITSHMQRLSVKWLASNGLEANHQKLLRIIAAAGPDGLSQSELTRKSQWASKRDRQEMLGTLAESGLIVNGFHSGRGESAADSRWRLAPGTTL